MKKKLLALIVTAVVACFTLAGCGIFVKNEERDYNQHIAEIKYLDMTSYVTKGELSDLFKQSYQYYQQYYSADELLEQFAVSLAKNELLLMKAREFFGEKLGIDRNSDLEKFLDYDEIRYARAKTNAVFQASLDAQVKKDIQSAQLNAGTEEETDEEEETPRVKNTHKWTDDEFQPDPSVGAEDIGELFPDIAEKFTDSYEIDAWKTVQKDYFKYKDFDYYYQEQLSSMLTAKYKRAVNADVSVSDAEIEGKYNEIIAANKANIIDEAAYKTAFENKDNPLLYHKYDGYFTVRSILLKFDEGQTAMIESLKKEYGANTDGYKAARARLATEFDGYIYGQKAGVTVDVSNPDYDDKRGASETNPIYSRKDVKFTDILAEISVDIAKAEAAASTDAEKIKARIETFDKWLYLVNDDPGMYDTENGNQLKTYTVSPKDTDTGYVEEYAELAWALASSGRGSYYLMSDAAEQAKIGADTIADVNYTDDAGVAKTAKGLSYTINDYGVQFIMINYYPVDKTSPASGITVINDDAGKAIAYSMGLDSVYDVEKGLTVREVIAKQLVEKDGNENYRNVEKSFFDEFEKDGIKRNDKVFNELLKELKKLLGA